MSIKKNIANFVTSVRLLGAIALFFVEPLSVGFFVVFGICGLSDALDGFLARTLKITSAFGSKLDSVADLTFYSSMMLNLFEKIAEKLFKGLWIFLFIILAIRIAVYLISAIRFNRFSSLHTILNKATGAGMFIIPLILLGSSTLLNIYGTVLCLIGLAAALQELVYYITLKEIPQKGEKIKDS